MNFQGKLMDSSGNVMPDGVYNMRMKIYSDETAGTLLWSAERLVSAGEGVTVTNGLFTIRVGRLVPLDSTLFDGSNDLFFEVELPSAATATSSSPSWTEGPMTPRNQLATSAYAFNADQLDGLDSSAFAQVAANNLFTGTNTIDIASTGAFKVVNSAASLFMVDTTNSLVTIGQSDTNGALFVLDTKTDPGDPTGSDGAMYYNSDSGKFRCYEGAWKNCITNLQDSYDNSTSPATITTTSASKGVGILAGTAPNTDLLTIDTNGNAVATDNTSAIKVNYEGGSGTIEGSGIRIDYAPGGTSGSTWSGMRIVSGNSSAGTSNLGLKIEGPASGAGTDTGIKITTGFDIGLDVASGGLQLADQSDPAAPADGNLRLYAKSVSGRMLLKARGPSGLDYPLQPSFFQNQICMVSAGTGTTMYTLGCGVTYTGTRSHPASDQDTGYATNFATTATSGNEAGFVTSIEQFFQGSQVGSNGYFFNTRIYTIDSASVRLFAGLNSQNTLANIMASDDPSGSRAGFSFSTVRGDSAWQFTTKDNSTQNLIDTGITYAANKVYDLYTFTPPYPNNGTIFWRIDNVTDGTTQEGSTSSNLPAGATSMRVGIGIETEEAVAKQLRIQRMYIETDR